MKGGAIKTTGLLAAALVTATALASLASGEKARTSDAADGELLALLGEQLFNDPNLSLNGTQSCATCHDSGHAFTDPRQGQAGGAVSVGDDGQSHGDRNTPTLTYALLSPAFHEEKPGLFKGGQFWDGRADDLTDQAGQPMLNPVEMGMPDKESVVARLRDNPAYVEGFTELFGPDALVDPESGFDHAAAALAAYQSTPEFAPFDSRFDRWRRGEEKFTAEEEFGYTVFITWNCRLCHQLQKAGVVERETFTNFEYHNIGIPVNPQVRQVSGQADDYIDHGLLQRPGIDDPAQDGKFKVPTLRNVAVTAPYMRNGIFNDLRTAVAFYNKYPSRRPARQINPETGLDWGPPEVDGTLSLPELRSGLEISDERIDALVAFLETLTDQRYEPLLHEQRAEREAAQAQD